MWYNKCMNKEKLIELAFEAQKNSYSPYSNFAVGACLLTKSGKVFCGTNIENASYPAGICAERVAVCKAISEGEKKFEAIAITCSGNVYPYPCGICRQFLSEFGNFKVIVAKSKDECKEFMLSDLLPSAFELK